MAKYKIHSVDGGYVPPMERVFTPPYPEVAAYSIGTPLKYDELTEGYGDSGEGAPEYIAMSGALGGTGGEYYVLAIRVTDSIVFEDENGNCVRLK